MQTEITVCETMSRNGFWKYDILTSKTLRWWLSGCRWSDRKVLVLGVRLRKGGQMKHFEHGGGWKQIAVC